ncbi:MAG: hypothetical protein ABI587_14525 [Gemmatimonadales bacterium]
MLVRRQLIVRTALGLTLTGTALAGCANAGEDLGIRVRPGVGFSATVLYDRDHDGQPSGPDSVLANVPVFLKVPGGPDTLAVDTTDAAGRVAFLGIPTGPYAIEVDASALGDSLETLLTPRAVQVFPSGNPGSIIALLTFPSLTVAQARALSIGSRALVTGLVLAGPQSTRDTSASLRDSTGAVRLTGVKILIGGFAAPGDTSRVLATVGVRNGQPVLTIASISLVVGAAGPAPGGDTLTTAVAATANGGALDADVVSVVGAEILSTSSANGDLTVTLDDGSGPLEMVVDSVLVITPGIFVVGDSLSGTGVLVPATGGAQWQFRPRFRQDFTIF